MGFTDIVGFFFDVAIESRNTFSAGRLSPPYRPHLNPPINRGASGVADSAGLTGSVYKARERIHRGMADPRLLAIPAS